MYPSLLQKIPIAIAGLVLIAAVLTIYIRSKNVTKSEFVKILKGTKYIQAGVLVFVFILTVFFGVFNHLKSKQYMMAVVALNYSEASQAQNSNGTRYNMAEIICDEVVEKAIEKGAFENVTVKQLKECLFVHPYVQGDVKDESNYHISTEFVVEYCASKHTQHLDAENVIAMIASAYKDYYIDKYTDNFDVAAQKEKPDFDSMEYMDIATYLYKKAGFVLNYLYGMAENGYSFVTGDNKTFNSLASQVYQFRETQIEENLRALILQHGVAKDKESYIDRLSYHNKNTDFTMQKNMASFDLCNEAVNIYAEEMTRVVLVPTWDGSGKYYMGRTKVGVDELSVLATSFSDRVASNNKEIMNNELIITKMNEADDDGTVKAEVDALIASIDQSIDNFTKEAIELGREYAGHQMNQCIAVSIYGVSLLSELKTIFVFACFAYVAAILRSVSKKYPKVKV